MNETGPHVAQPPRRMRGFTLIELLVTVAIIAIAAAVALPSFREFGIRMATKDNSNQLVGALNVARAEAVKRGRPVALLANGGNWNNGWQIVAAKESLNAGVIEIEATPTSPGATAAACAAYIDNAANAGSTVPLCMQHRDALEGGYTILGKGQDNAKVIFGPAGSLAGNAEFDFSICRPSAHADAAESYRINVAASGIISSRRGTAGAPAGACN